MLTTAELFDITTVDQDLQSLFFENASPISQPWQLLKRMDEFLASLEDMRLGYIHPTAVVVGKVFLAKTAKIHPHALIEGPAWIGEGAEVGHAAYIRGGSILASKVKIGHSSEVKRALLLNGAKAPHFNYIGDSIIGQNANLGAGVKLANFRVFGDEVKVDGIGTGLRKFSAAVGDNASIGCNSVLAPGTIVGANSIAYHGAMLRGSYPAHSIIKHHQEHTIAPLKPQKD